MPTSLIMIFGATGDLAKRKLFPSLYHLYKKGKLTEHFAVIGVARRPLSHEEFKARVKDSVLTSIGETVDIEDFVSHFYYQPNDVSNQIHIKHLRTYQMSWMKRMN